jgi:hypothetical protein
MAITTAYTENLTDPLPLADWLAEVDLRRQSPL